MKFFTCNFMDLRCIMHLCKGVPNKIKFCSLWSHLCVNSLCYSCLGIPSFSKQADLSLKDRITFQIYHCTDNPGLKLFGLGNYCFIAGIMLLPVLCLNPPTCCVLAMFRDLAVSSMMARISPSPKPSAKSKKTPFKLLGFSDEACAFFSMQLLAHHLFRR